MKTNALAAMKGKHASARTHEAYLDDLDHYALGVFHHLLLPS